MEEFFSEADFSGTLQLNEGMPDIGQVLSIIADAEAVSIDAVNTMAGTSAEGVHLTGCKCAVEIRMRQKVSYAAEGHGQSIHIMEDEGFQCAYVPVPPVIEGTNTAELIRCGYLKTKVEIGDTVVKKTGSRSMFTDIRLCLKLYLIPSYSLCCSMLTEGKGSDMIMCHSDGTGSIHITAGCYNKNIYPSWSPSGREIAYLSNCDGSYMLYIINPRDSIPTRVIDKSYFRSVSSFCWSADGHNIVFASSIDGAKELFTADIYSSTWRQLTHGGSTVKSYKPKCSPDGKSIAFLKSVSGITYLYTMDMRGLNCKKVSPVPGVKDFDWRPDSRYIACIRSTGGRPDEICVIDTDNFDETVLSGCDGVIHKRKIAFSPDGRSIAFIGSNFGTEDVLVFNMEHGPLANITNNYSNILVSDFVWKVDGTKIYYASNELYYYNIYSLSLKDRARHQLTNCEACDIKLCYRPRIQ